MTVTILGAGIGGLAAAHYITKRTIKPIHVIEATDRVGGWINSTKVNDEFIFEAGPRTIRPKGAAGLNTLELIEEIKLGKYVKPIKSNHLAAKNRMIYANDQLCLLPNSISGALQTTPPFSKSLLKIVLNDLKGEHKKCNDESIYDFVKRRFGKELADYAISPLICGITAGNAKEISVKFLMNDLWQKEQKYGGVIKGMIMAALKRENPSKKDVLYLKQLARRAKTEKWSVYSIEDGLETFPRKLAGFVQRRNVKISMETPCKDLEFHKDMVRVMCDDDVKETKYVVSAIPSYKLAEVVERQHPILANELKCIPNVDVAVINFQYSDPNLIKQPGFGVLVPPIEKLPVLGIIFDSCCFETANNTVLTVMMGGHWFKQLFGDNPSHEQLTKTAQENIKKILGISASPEKINVNILRKCIPQYTVGHFDRVQRIRRYISEHNMPLYLCGASYDGVAINDVILSARAVAEQKDVWI